MHGHKGYTLCIMLLIRMKRFYKTSDMMGNFKHVVIKSKNAIKYYSPENVTE